MKPVVCAALCAAVLVMPAISDDGTDLDALIGQTRCVEGLSPAADRLISRLEKELAKIFQAGHLMPFRVQYGEGRPRNVYAEPWMMWYTLARAYPYVSRETQSAITAYLRQETQFCPPWSRTALGPTGAYRQGDPDGVPELGLPPRNYQPTGTMFYTLWLYGYNTGDWKAIQPQWPNLKRLYAELAARPPTYEAISGAIAMSRIAKAFGEEHEPFAAEALRLLKAGTNFEVFRRNAHLAYSGTPKWQRGSDGITFALFFLSPEVARYMAEQPELKRAVESYVDQAVSVWPLWWMAQAPIGDWGYFDEGCCAGPETRMMLYNYFAWVRQRSARELGLLVDAPDALVGDCYYLQNLVTAIEACGRTSWQAQPRSSR